VNPDIEEENRKEGYDDWLLPEETREMLVEMFQELKDDVNLEVFLNDDNEDPFNQLTYQFTRDLARISEKIKVNVNDLKGGSAEKFHVERGPSVLISPEKYSIRFTGAPAGEEGKSFLKGLILASTGDSELEVAQRKLLAELNEKRQAMIFVTPGCPYCPGQVVNAFRAAVERPDLVKAECIEASGNIDLARKYNVGAVPHTVINGITTSRGLEPEDRFIEELITLELEEDMKKAKAKPSLKVPESGTEDVELVIIGAGPAGITAGIYAVRSGMKAVIIEKDNVGGQVALTPVVENYPGFKNIPGKNLMDILKAQALDYVPILENEGIEEIKVGKRIEVISSKRRFLCDSVIVATGAEHRKLGVKGEERLSGRGVSYCATCDGYLYRGKKVLVVGGGDSALTDSLYLNSLGAKVRIVHRRDELRGQSYLRESIERENIPVIWNSVVKRIGGKDKVKGIELEDTSSGAIKKMSVDAVFISVGYNPNSQLLQDIGVKVNEYGFVQVGRRCRTNIPRIYAAGDITGGVRQIVTAVSEGATAALSAYENLHNPYWKSR